jgi:hypothetical protein
MTPHLTRDELIRWRDQGASADRERTMEHLASCDACGTVYSEIVDTAPVDAPVTRADIHEFVARGAALGPGRTWAVRAPGLAVAASIAVVALSAALIPGVRRAIFPGDPPDAVRATSILLVSPVGDVRLPVEFAWRSPVHAANYRVELRDADRRLLGAVTTTRERTALPEQLRAVLAPNVQYEWAVTALDEGGEPLLTSRPETFRILADPSR